MGRFLEVVLVAGLGFPALRGQDADAPKRLPEPTAAAEKAAEKLIRDLFKEEYARKSPADVKALARKLLDQGIATRDDMNLCYVLLREARELAVQAGDCETLLAAVEQTARIYDVDGPALKAAALGKVGVPKSAAIARDLVQGYLALVEESVRADRYDIASAAAAKAETFARAAQDPSLASRAAETRKEAAFVREEHQKVKADKSGNPEPEAAGKFYCFVKGDWSKGLPFLVKASDLVLKALAQKDLDQPVGADGRIDAGDGWWDLAEKEKHPVRKARILARARHWYQQALPEATGFARIKIGKRLAQADEAKGTAPGINLLEIIDPKQDGVVGDWAFDGPALISPAVEWACLQVPFEPPEEYDLRILVERKSGGDAFIMGLVAGERQFRAMLDGRGGGVAGFDVLDGNKLAFDNETTRKVRVFEDEKPKAILCSVRKGGTTVSVDGKILLEWRGAYGRFSNHTKFAVPNKRALYLAAYATCYRISQASLVQVSGQGKKLR